MGASYIGLCTLVPRTSEDIRLSSPVPLCKNPPGVIPPKVWSQTVSNSMMSPAELRLSVLLGHSGPRECVIQHLLSLVGQTLAHTSTQFTPGPTPLTAPRPKLPGSGHSLQSQNSGTPRAARLGPPSIVQIHSHYLGSPSERDKAF